MRPETLGRDLATLFDRGSREITLEELEYQASRDQAPVQSRRPLLVLTGAFAAVVLAGVSIGLIAQPDVPQSSIPPASTPTTTADPSPTTTKPESSTIPETADLPFETDGPLAMITEASVEFVRGGDRDVLDIPDVRKGVVQGDRLVFGLDGSSGVWTWPAEPGSEIRVPGGTEMVSLLVGQTDTEASAWFEDAATVDARELILFREIDSSTDPVEERMIILDVLEGDTSLVFDKTTRRDDLQYEEVAMAYIGDAALTSDGVVALFGFGDATWIESYDLTGRRLPDIDVPTAIEGIVMELDAADHSLALGVETEFHAGIQQIWLIDLVSRDLTGPYTHDVEGESLRDLSYDGATVTAAIQDSEGNRVGLWAFDGSEVRTSTDPGMVALP